LDHLGIVAEVCHEIEEALDGGTPADVDFGKQEDVLSKRTIIDHKTLQGRRHHRSQTTVQAISSK
jgi:hypothetical protein